MDLQIIVPALAFAIQLISAFYAIKLVRYTENRLIGVVFVLVVFLMSFRRFISLFRFFSDGTISMDIFAETVALAISILILSGIILIARFLKSAVEQKHAANFSETLYHALFNQSPDGVLLLNKRGEILEFNDAVHLQLGYTREEFNTLRIADIDPVESPADIQASLERVLKAGKDQFEVKHTTKQGELRDILVIIQRIELAGEFFFQTIWRDITERKRAEKALRESEDKFRSIFEEANDGIMIGDMATMRHIEANKAICGMLGYSREELVGQTVDAIHPEDALPFVREIFAKQGRGEISLAPEVPMLRKDGSVFYADINSTSVTFGGKQCLIGNFRDITERMQAEEKLRKSDNQLRESQKVAKLGSWDLNLDSLVLEWSEETYRLFDKFPENFVPSHDEFTRLVHPDDLETMLISFRNALASDDTPYHVAVRIINDSGREWVMEAFGVVRRDPTGKALGIFGTAQDITELKKNEEKIKQSEEFIRNILDTVDEGFIVVDRDYRILTANSAYCAQVGDCAVEIIGKNCFTVSHKSARPCYELGEECVVKQVFENGQPHVALHRHTDPEGNILYAETKGYPVKNLSGSVISVIETINNITERYLLEEERLKSQKLESIGTLAGGIAHDFNNLLQGIFGFISMAKMSHDRKEESLSMLEQAEKALQLSVNLTNQLLTFSKGGKPIKKLINILPVLENAVKFALSGSNTNYELDILDRLWLVEADRGQLAQVIQNIALNANQSMAGGGKIQITLSNADLAKDAIIGLPEGGRFVRIIIEDSGIGINAENLARIFDPYFTTKQKGSGLGLATSYSIIKNHGGIIEVKSEVNQGSTFTLYIPASLEAKNETASISPEVVATRNGKVLLMDDEELIRDVAKAMVISLGHEIVCANDGHQAVSLFEAAKEAGQPFDLVILDLTIKGGMGGEEVVKQIREITPEVKAVVSSGYADSPVVADYRAYGFSAALNKPYQLEALKNCLNQYIQDYTIPEV